MLNVNVRVVPAGTVKLPYHVSVWPEIIGSDIEEPLKALVDETYDTVAGDVGSVATISSSVTFEAPVFERVRVAVVVPPVPLLKQPEELWVVTSELSEMELVVAAIGEMEAKFEVSVCLI
jgi:hypothetical protein